MARRQKGQRAGFNPTRCPPISQPMIQFFQKHFYSQDSKNGMLRDAVANRDFERLSTRLK